MNMKQSASTSAANSIRRRFSSRLLKRWSSGVPLAVKTASGMPASAQTRRTRAGGPSQSSGSRHSQPSQPASASSARQRSRSGSRQNMAL